LIELARMIKIILSKMHTYNFGHWCFILKWYLWY
jgi:hypothetical protein